MLDLEFMNDPRHQQQQSSCVKAFLYQIVASEDTGIDVDKWERFTRDGEEWISLKVLLQPR